MLNLNTGIEQAIDRQTGKTPRMSENARIGQVMKVLAYHDYGLTSYDLAKMVGLQPRQTRNILAKMVARGLVDGREIEHRPGWSKWLVYPAGKSNGN